jgi:2-aminoadipate transaminase
MAVPLSRPDAISLAAGFTDNATLPLEPARDLLDELLASRTRGEPALQYGNTTGLARLCELTAARLQSQDRAVAPSGARRRAGAYAPERLLLTHGSQQLLYIVTECLCDPGDIVLLEDPTYFVFLGILQSHGIRCRGIRTTGEGVDLEHLEAVLDQLARQGESRRVKLLYLVSYFQNPTGTTTSNARKQGALALLRRHERRAGHPLYLLEDAAYRELRYEGPDVASSLAVPGAAERAIYVGTYSKPFATGVRVGFGLLPKELRAAAVRVKGNHDFGTSSLLQHLLAEALESGRYDEHLQRLRARYATKVRVMLEALQRRLPPEVSWRAPLGGMYVWVTLPRGVRSGLKSKLFQRVLARQVLYVPGALCYGVDAHRPIPQHDVRLSFGSATETQIEEGIRRLGEAIRDVLPRKPHSQPAEARRGAAPVAFGGPTP